MSLHWGVQAQNSKEVIGKRIKNEKGLMVKVYSSDESDTPTVRHHKHYL